MSTKIFLILISGTVLIISFVILFIKKIEPVNFQEEEEEETREDYIKWKPVGDKIKTVWGENLNSSKVWPEYPRPQLERKEWKNLNGFWDYYIGPKGSKKPDKPNGKILVPFPIESSLSGIMRKLTEKEELWYEKVIKIKKEWKNKAHLLLHFGAVDYIAEVYINYIKIGKHIGGYTPFYFDIKKYVNLKKNNFTITVKVFDPTDSSYQAVGKQTLKPREIWYTPISGIWQTVWIESVNDNYIKRLNMLSNFDQKELLMNVELNSNLQLSLSIKIYFNNTIIYNDNNKKSNTNISIHFNQTNFHPWTPDNPNLYNIEISLFDKGKEVDYIKSYSAIRKISAEKDVNNIMRFKLNNKVLFHMGILDQGYFPDGLYTPPSEEAMIFDIKLLKEMGFNTIRKHAKVENSRYYYHCDKIGMMVWQDMPSGDNSHLPWNYSHIGYGEDTNRTEESKANYYHEWEEIINFGKFFSCIVVWVPFNEGWGQFDTEKVANFTRKKDPTRLINSASGGNHRICGDILDLHYYPQPLYYLKYEGEVNVIGEYGGLGLEIKEHTWKINNWGYSIYNNMEEITRDYVEFSKKIQGYIKKGISGAIYTQTTDCESEINGLITYDRKVIKLCRRKVREANTKLIKTLKE